MSDRDWIVFLVVWLVVDAVLIFGVLPDGSKV
jgi:hypothetical protein